MRTVLSLVATFLFAISTIVCSLVSIPISLVDPTGRFYLIIGRFWARTFLWFFRIRVTAHGLEHIERGKNYVYLANHSSYVDIPVVMTAIPDEIRIILKKSLMKIPIWGWSLKAGPFIGIDRTNPAEAAESLKEAVEKIQKGASILLFPEGTRTSDGKLQPFKRGAFRLAYDSKTPMLPIALTGTYDILSREGGLPRFGGHVTVTVGEPIDPAMFSEGHPRTQELAMMKFAEEKLRAMLVKS